MENEALSAAQKIPSVDTGHIIPFPEPGLFPWKSVCNVTSGLNIQLLYSAYMQGCFPWYNEDEGEPVLWHSPDPRFCLLMEDFHVSRSIDRFLKRSPYTYTMDRNFECVIEGCRSVSRPDQDGTWIGKSMMETYIDFFKAGYAHSVEAWYKGKLAGGLYGVLIGSVFFGESMFTLMSDSAKSAFVLFARAFASCGGKMIDSQVYTDNIARYGARNISRTAFLRYEAQYLPKPLAKDLKSEFEAAAGVFNIRGE